MPAVSPSPHYPVGSVGKAASSRLSACTHRQAALHGVAPLPRLGAVPRRPPGQALDCGGLTPLWLAASAQTPNDTTNPGQAAGSGVASAGRPDRARRYGLRGTPMRVCGTALGLQDAGGHGAAGRRQFGARWRRALGRVQRPRPTKTGAVPGSRRPDQKGISSTAPSSGGSLIGISGSGSWTAGGGGAATAGRAGAGALGRV
jgi:hypothetical protein